jgi:hypothetical protein
LQGGVNKDDEEKLERWEAIFTQAIGKHFEELPAHAMTDDGY